MKPTVDDFNFSSVEVPEEEKKIFADMLYKVLLDQWSEADAAAEVEDETEKPDSESQAS